MLTLKLHRAILNEEFDAKTAELATDIISKLKSVNFGGLKAFESARDEAVQDALKALSGEEGKGVVQKALELFKSKYNPLADTIVLTNAIYNFFLKFSAFLNAVSTNVENADEISVQELLTGQADTGDGIIKSLANLSPEGKKKIQQLENLIINGLKPNAELAKISKNNWMVKYFKNNLRQVSQSILGAKVGEISRISDEIKKTFSRSAAVGQAVMNTKSQASLPPSQTSGEAQTKGTSQTQASGKKPDFSQVDKVLNNLKNSVNVSDEKTLRRLLNILSSKGLLKDL